MTQREDLLRRIRLGEDSTLELKRISLAGSRVTTPRRNDVSDELGAFANGRGGVLVLGVDDKTRDVVGIPTSTTRLTPAISAGRSTSRSRRRCTSCDGTC